MLLGCHLHKEGHFLVLPLPVAQQVQCVALLAAKDGTDCLEPDACLPIKLPTEKTTAIRSACHMVRYLSVCVYIYI